MTIDPDSQCGDSLCDACGYVVCECKDELRHQVERLTAENAALLEWKNAIVDAAVVGWTYNAETESNPRKAVESLLCWESKIALDPLVSAEAKALHDEIAALRAEVDKLRPLQYALGNTDIREVPKAVSDAWRDSEGYRRDVLKTQDERIAELEHRLNKIRRHWQRGIGELNTPWRRQMAELVGDVDGLAETAE